MESNIENLLHSIIGIVGGDLTLWHATKSTSISKRSAICKTP